MQSYNQWKDGTIHTNYSEKLFRHNQLHAQYYNIAKKVRDKLDVNNKNNYYILNVDVKQFSEKAMHYLDIFNFNHHSIFFSIYLNSFGVTSAWIQMIDLNLPKKPLVRYTQGKFSAPLILKNDKMHYVKSSGLKGYLHYFSNTVPNVIVATTYEELVFASNFLKKNEFNFIIIDL